MGVLIGRPSVTVKYLAGALALLLAAAPVTATTTYAAAVSEDCTGTCPGPEGPDVSNPEPEISEPDYGSEGGYQSEPPGDSEPDTSDGERDV